MSARRSGFDSPYCRQAGVAQLWSGRFISGRLRVQVPPPVQNGPLAKLEKAAGLSSVYSGFESQGAHMADKVHFEVRSRRIAGEILGGSDGISYKWLISIGDVFGSKPCFGFNALPRERRLRMLFDDVTQDHQERYGYQRATEADIQKIIDFCNRVDGKCLIHCEAGISRSSAAAIILCAIKLGAGNEEAAVGMVAQHGIQADGENRFSPNRWIVRLADQLLGRQGKLFSALETFDPVFNGGIVAR